MQQSEFTKTYVHSIGYQLLYAGLSCGQHLHGHFLAFATAKRGPISWQPSAAAARLMVARRSTTARSVRRR
jgi:hypothetical protein